MGGLVVPARAREAARVRRRRHLNIRGKSANLPAITDRDWLDIKFGVDVGVDYYALSFVRNAEVSTSSSTGSRSRVRAPAPCQGRVCARAMAPR